MFVTFEGGEAVGKSSTLEIVTAKLENAGLNVLRTKEPGGTPLGVVLRTVLLDEKTDLSSETEFLLFQTDRAHHVRSIVAPALERGQIILCDRYILSSIAYQIVARGLPKDVALQIINFATGGLIPDLTVLLTVDLDVGFERMRSRGKENRIDRETRAFHEKVHGAYKDLYGGAFAKEWIRIDTTPREMTPEVVAQQVVSAILATRSRM